MLALINSGVVLEQVPEGGTAHLPDGRIVSPAVAGWVSMAISEPVAAGETPPADVPDGFELHQIAEAAPVASGQRIVSTSVEMIAGVPTFVHVLEAMTEEEIWGPVRAERDARLAACDWTQLPDSPLPAASVAEWATYRQALRDVPATQTDPENIIWPSAPA